MYQYIIPQFTVWLCRVVDTVMRAGGFKMGKFALGLASLAAAAKPKYDIAGNSRSRLMISRAAATLFCTDRSLQLHPVRLMSGSASSQRLTAR